jgi:adenylyltransferase/sulfurtransferase
MSRLSMGGARIRESALSPAKARTNDYASAKRSKRPTEMILSSEEIERYARHIVLREVGGPGQQRLKQARVLAVGAGGLGAPLLQYLAAAGVGTLGIVDDDEVSISNLQRQVIHATSDLGRLKVDSACDAIHRLNPHVRVETHAMRLTESTARQLVSAYDVVADGSDNFATRYVVSDACFHERKPLVTAAVGGFDASLTTLRPFERDAEGRPNPTYRCLFPEPPPAGTVPSCEEAGVLGALTGIVGAMMALEVIREIVGFGEGLVGRLLLFDARSMRFETLRYGFDPDNPLSGVTAPR